jgi:hybrid polyketide synthase/nonribosomal peptide synthetase ACE1
LLLAKHSSSRLGIPRSAVATPFFQAFIDYRQGQNETTTWGDCQLELLSFHPSKLAYDVALDILDDANGDCILTFVVRNDLYRHEDAEQLAKSYKILTEAFASRPEALLSEPDMFDEEEIEEVLNSGRG